MTINEVLDGLKEHFQGAYEALRRNLTRLRSGRANPNLLDNIRVQYYGQATPLSQVAAVQTPEPRLLTVKPWDPTLLKDIERAIQQSDLGLNPNNDGTLIRLAIPPLTEDRRKDLVKQAKGHGEDAKVAVRNSRRDANNQLKDLQKDGDLTEDQLQRELKKVQEMTDKATAKIDEMVATKEKELMEV